MSSDNDNAIVVVESSSSNTATIYSSSDDETVDARGILRNCIVKHKMKDVYDKWTAKRNNVKWIYGIVDYLDDQDDDGKCAWHVQWHIGPYNVAGFDGFGPYLAVHEDDLILVRHPGDNMLELDVPYLRMYVAQNADGSYEWKRYEAQCEFCFGHSCDRVQFKETLQEDIEDILLYDQDLPANAKRWTIYRKHIQHKFGRLGSNNCRQPSGCVMKLVRGYFPNPTGVDYVGYHPS